jgi:hypothetical protein
MKKNNIPRDTESAEVWKKLFAERNIDAEILEIGSEQDGYAKGMDSNGSHFLLRRQEKLVE